MATIKVERGLHFGTPYSPDMQQEGKRPEPSWSTLRDQVRDAEALGYDTVIAVEPSMTRIWRWRLRPRSLRNWN